MHEIRNLTNSPHKVKLADGSFGRVPARGTVTLDVHPKYLPHIARSGYLVVSEAPKKAKPKKQAAEKK